MNIEEYTRVYKKYFRLACKIANEQLNDYYLSGDVAQEVFKELFEKKDFLEENQIKYWVVLNCNRRATDMCKKAYRKHENTVDDWYAHEDFIELGENPEDMILRKEAVRNKETVLGMLKSYNAQWYEILMKHHLENVSYSDLARIYGIEVAYLRMQVHRARKWLDFKLDELYEDKIFTD